MTGTLAALGFVALLQAADGAPRISIDDVKKAMQANAVLVVDVRDAASYAAGHIEGAVSIPESDLEKQLPRLRAEKRPIVTYCS